MQTLLSLVFIFGIMLACQKLANLYRYFVFRWRVRKLIKAMHRLLDELDRIPSFRNQPPKDNQ